MHCSSIVALFSLIVATQATAVAVRNANHISMYTTTACNDNDKYYKWKSTSTCACVPVDLNAGSIYTDHEPFSKVVAFSDGNCKNTLGPVNKQKCVETASEFDKGAIGSVMFWLKGVCDVVEGLEDIAADVEHLLELASAAA